MCLLTLGTHTQRGLLNFVCICDPLRENFHFRAKCIVEIRVKIAETWSLVAKRDYDIGKNYSLSFSRWSDVRVPLLPLTASSQRREVQPRIRARCAWNDKCAERVYQQLRVTEETLQTNNMASPADTATTETVAVALRELALSQGDQEGLAEFLTEYFASNNNEFLSGK